MLTRSAAIAVLALLGAAACAATSEPGPDPRPFRVLETRFAPGDRIELAEVRSDDPHFESAGSLRVRGTYTLASRPEATLYFGLTNGRFEGASSRRVAAGSGTFDFAVHVLAPGDAHVSLYAGPEPDNCIGKLRFASVPGAPR